MQKRLFKFSAQATGDLWPLDRIVGRPSLVFE